MGVAEIITHGFGSFGSIPDVVRYGFTPGSVVEFLSQQRLVPTAESFMSRGPRVADSMIEAPETTPWLSTIEFDEPSRTASVGTTWPVTVGFPTGRRQIAAASDLCCAVNGVPIPTQTKLATPWRPDRLHAGNSDGPRFTILDTQATFYGGGTAPSIQVYKNVEAPDPDEPVLVSDDGSLITMSTGVGRITVNKSTLEIKVYESSTLRATGYLYWTDTDGNEHTVDTFDLEVETEGDLRSVLHATGHYAYSGTQRHQFVLRIHAFAGLPYFKFDHTLIWDQNETLYCTGSGTTLTTKTWVGGGALEHGWATADPVKFPYCDDPTTTTTANDGTLPTALDSTTTFYVRRLSASTLSVHASAANATNSTSPLDVATGFGSGHKMYVQRQKPVLANYGLKFTINGTVTQARFDVEGAGSPTSYTVAGGQTCHAVQSLYGTATLTSPAGSTTGETRLAGWADAQTSGGVGLAASVYKLTQQCPKKLLVSDSQLQVQFWGGSTAMSMISEDRLPAEFKPPAVADYSTYNLQKLADWIESSGEANPFGTSKTETCWVWPALSSAATNRLYNDLIQEPPTPCADPEYALGTGALGPLPVLANLPAAYSDIADGLEALHTYITTKDSSHGDMDFWSFGDVRLFRNGAFRTFDNGGYRGGIPSWKLFACTGERNYLIQGFDNARHVMDVDTCQVSQTFSGGDTYTKQAGRTASYEVIHWALTDANDLGLYVDRCEQLLMCYCLTGYERAADILDLKDGMIAGAGYGLTESMTTEPIMGSASAGRANYGFHANMIPLYQWTGTTSYLKAMKRFATFCRNSELLSAETDGDGNQLMPAPGSDYFFGFHHLSLEQIYDLTGWDDAHDALMALQLDYADPDASNYAAPDYACTRPPYRFERARRSGAFAFAYDRSGDFDYLNHAVERVRRELLAVQRGGTYDGLTTLDLPTAPLFMETALRTLASWERSGYGELSDTEQNTPIFYSESLSDDPYYARMTVFVMKEAGVAVNVRLVLKDANLTTYETLGAWRSTVTRPDTTTDVVAIGSTFEPTVTIAAGLPEGQYKIWFDNKGVTPAATGAVTSSANSAGIIRFTMSIGHGLAVGNHIRVAGASGAGAASTNALHTLTAVGPALMDTATVYVGDTTGGTWTQEDASFAACPKSDAPFMVVQLNSNKDLYHECCVEPSRYYIKLTSGQTAISWTTLGGGDTAMSRPIVVLDADGDVVERIDYTGDASGETGSVTIPLASRTEVISLLKGSHTYGPTGDTQRPGIRLGNCERYVAVTADQFFIPS